MLLGGLHDAPARRHSTALFALLLLHGCRAQPPATASAPPSPEACAARQSELVAFVQKLPDRAVVGAVRVELPESNLGAAPGSGPVLELSETALVLDGKNVAETTTAERARRIGRWAEASLAARSGSARPALYVAAAPSVDVGTLRAHLAEIPAAIELRLLVRTHALPKPEPGNATSSEAHALAAELLAERDTARRAEIAARGYARFSRCGDVARAAEVEASRDAAVRWPALRAALLDALPRCACGELDGPALQQLVAAEQRAGAASLGALPLSFLRDERCGASMPLRAIGKLVRQVESFDAEFAGGWQQDALKFEEVLADERLLGFFCNALPGETLAARQRARGVLYWRAPSDDGCQAWRFEPLAPGAPMGTWRRAGAEPLAFHYWQAAEEIRLFGPVPAGSKSKPTDDDAWACRQNYQLVGVDADAIRTDAGAWFYTEAACRRAAPASGAPAGCVAPLAFGGATQPAAPQP